jgi:acyl-CoA synthetase (AMP-forming)/AMP-acid ligase II
MEGRVRTALASATTLVELLEDHASASLGGYTYIKGGINAGELSFSRLAAQAKAIAVRLSIEASPASRALLLYPPGLDFLSGFFGCLYAGIVAIPLPSPERARLKRSLPRLQAIIEDAGSSLILAPAVVADELRGPIAEALPQLRWLATDKVEAAQAEQWQMSAQRPDDVAYLQYTSGSTASPRGVMLTHANVLRNLHCFGQGMDYDASSVEVTWMPHFHDYGLVGGLLHPLYCNIHAHILSPLVLVKRPEQWLQAITQHRATHSHAPNFAYELCIQRITEEQKRLLDLSSWRTAGNGAEPVRPDTLRRFADAFVSCGFSAGSFYPAYGLAEATLFVTARQRGATYHTVAVGADALAQHRVVHLSAREVSDNPRLIVSCGVAAAGADLRIIDPQTRKACPPDSVGEVWFADRSVAPGYWRRDEETRATFTARLADDPAAGPFLRTGDLGFLHQDELYLTGRLKDLIVVAGANHYPQDIEWSIQSNCPEVRRDHCVAVGVEGDCAEQAVILAEPEGMQHDWPGLIRRIRGAVSREHGLPVAAVAIVPRGTIFKTSSGKVQRSACRDAFCKGQLAPISMWTADQAIEISTSSQERRDLQRWICAKLTNIDRDQQSVTALQVHIFVNLVVALGATLQLPPQAIDPDVPLPRLGLDSLGAFDIRNRLQQALGLQLALPDLLGELSVNQLVERIAVSQGVAAAHVWETGEI